MVSKQLITRLFIIGGFATFVFWHLPPLLGFLSVLQVVGIGVALYRYDWHPRYGVLCLVGLLICCGYAVHWTDERATIAATLCLYFAAYVVEVAENIRARKRSSGRLSSPETITLENLRCTPQRATLIKISTSIGGMFGPAIACWLLKIHGLWPWFSPPMGGIVAWYLSSAYLKDRTI